MEAIDILMNDSFTDSTIPLEKYKEFDSNFAEDLYKAIDLENCVNLRISAGGTGIESVKTQISQVREFLSAK